MIAKRVNSGLAEYLHRHADAKGIPMSGAFELTPVCNMQCNMCYVRKTAKEMEESAERLRSVDEWISMAEQLLEQGTLFLLLTGGEPFMYPGFRELYTKLRNMGFVLSINTNGTMIDESTVDWLVHYPPQRVNISLYGASDATYERLCHNPHGFSQAKKAIELLQDNGINVKLNCSVTPDNYSDLEQIIAYSNERKLVLQAISYMFPPLRRDANSIGQNQRFSAEDCAYVDARIRYLQRGADDLRNYCNNVEQCCPVEENASHDCEGDYVRCRAGKSSYWITWDGRMLLCAMMDEPHFNPFEDGFAQSWDQLKEAAIGIRLPSECSVCEAKDICRSCAAMVYTETGTYHTKPQYRCDLYRATPDACRRVLSEEESQ